MEPISDDTPLSLLTVGQLRAIVREEATLQITTYAEANPGRVMVAFKDGVDRMSRFATQARQAPDPVLSPDEITRRRAALVGRMFPSQEAASAATEGLVATGEIVILARHLGKSGFSVTIERDYPEPSSIPPLEAPDSTQCLFPESQSGSGARRPSGLPEAVSPVPSA